MKGFLSIRTGSILLETRLELTLYPERLCDIFLLLYNKPINRTGDGSAIRSQIVTKTYHDLKHNPKLGAEMIPEPVGVNPGVAADADHNALWKYHGGNVILVDLWQQPSVVSSHS